MEERLSRTTEKRRSPAALPEGLKSPPAVAGKMSSLDPRALRQLCGAFATGVAIVSTTTEEGSPCGLTINSFTSVSLAPPLILWALNKDSPSRPTFDAGRPFAVSILAEEQEELALRFARPVPDKFSEVPHHFGRLGTPIIDGTIGHLECEAFDSFEAGDHVVYLGLVMHGSRQPERPPLAFHQGAFGRVQQRSGAPARNSAQVQR
jgi:flavin reductase (DIM6/NTAB) family NADH-FMN oxidoreductase RutF